MNLFNKYEKHLVIQTVDVYFTNQLSNAIPRTTVSDLPFLCFHGMLWLVCGFCDSYSPDGTLCG